MSDLGLTHIALTVADIDASLAFYEKYANLKAIHRRTDRVRNIDVAWISDGTRLFAIVLIQSSPVAGVLHPDCHLGVACPSREEVDRLCEEAQLQGVLLQGPNDWGPPVGYWAYLRDPDGHTLEISFGQELALTLEQANL